MSDRRFWLRARGRSKSLDLAAAIWVRWMLAQWGTGEPREIIIDEVHHFENTPENRATFEKLWQQLRERGADPLTVECPHCQEPAGNRCGTVNGYSRHTHKARVRLAYQMAAHADPALDEWPQLGPVSPCGICGSGLPQRHRIVDAIVVRPDDETPEEIAGEFGCPVDAVLAVRAWALRWPGAAA